MGYYVIKGDKSGEHKGRTVLFDGLLFSATNLASPTLFKTMEEATDEMERSKHIQGSRIKFEIEEVEDGIEHD